MPVFEKLRVSLARADAPPMLQQIDAPDPHMSRTEFLRAAFAEPRRFIRNDVVLTFYPLDAGTGYAAGFFAREHPETLRRADLTPYVAENYEPALMILSLDQAQIIWMESNTVGSPKQVLESFFKNLSKKTDLKDWQAFLSYFERQDDYWEAVRLHRQEISKVIFRFVPPNAFEGTEWAQEFYTAIQKEAQNEILEETFKGKPGTMNLEGPLMTASAEIAEKGAGDRELRGAGNKVIYTSNEGRVSEKVDEEDMPTPQSPNFVGRVISRLFGNAPGTKSP